MVSKRLLLEVLEDVLTKLLLQTVAVESEEALQTIPVWRREERKGKGRKRREAGLGAGVSAFAENALFKSFGVIF